MPPSLLRSQLTTLERPGDDEQPVTVVVHGDVAETVSALLRQLGTEQGREAVGLAADPHTRTGADYSFL